MPSKGTTFSYMKHLALYEHDFIYKNKRYDYADVKHIHFFYTLEKNKKGEEPSPLEVPPFRNVFLSLEFFSGEKLRIKHQTIISSKNTLTALHALTLTAEFLSEKTFLYRLANYEKTIQKEHYFPWDGYKIFTNGDLYKGLKKELNLKDKYISCYLFPFSVKCLPSQQNLFLRFYHFIKGNFATFSLNTDRDCFLFLMKHYINLEWQSETIRHKSSYQDIIATPLLCIAAALSKADGYVSKQEIIAFQKYFNITPQTNPQSTEIFNNAKKNPISIDDESLKIYKAFKHTPHQLLFILKGFIYTALSDKKDSISDAQMEILTQISYVFQISIQGFTQLYQDVLSAEKLRQNFKYNTHTSSAKKTSQTPEQTPFSILGLTPQASWKEIKQTYRNLARRYHPDIMLANGKSPLEIEEASEILKEINAAYTILEKQMA